MEWIKTSQNSKKVSVPYRGYSFFNSVKSLFLSLTMTKVSVPYRGYSFFNVDIIYLKFDNVLLVSVPYRGYSFFNRFVYLDSEIRKRVSVPYRGYSFFNLPPKTRMATGLKTRFAGQNYF